MGIQKKLGRARRAQGKHAGHGLDCGCDGFVNLAGCLVCDHCGYVSRVDVWMPSSGLVGETREVGTWCRGCGSEVEGQVLIVERQDA